MKRWVERTLSLGVEKIREEFMELKRYCPPNMCCKTFVDTWDKGLSRYKDVPCQEAHRVVLSGPGNSFIHANYMPTPANTKRYICTQGPLDATVIDFWRMVWQEQCEYVIMLCGAVDTDVMALMGTDRPSGYCPFYWPRWVLNLSGYCTRPCCNCCNMLYRCLYCL